jgi:methanethiol S-methyltransferase
MPVMTTPGALDRDRGSERDMRVTIIEPVSAPAVGHRNARGERIFAWGGALLFAAALGYFLYTYAFTFGESQDGSPSAPAGSGVGRAIAWNVLLFTVFALHHSVFARTRVRALVARTVPGHLERSFYVWVASALFIAVCALWQPVAGIAWAIPPWLAYAVLLFGIGLTLASARVIDVWDLAGVRQATVRSSDSQRLGVEPSEGVGTGEFKTTGPYGFVRHPIYSGWFLMVLGIPVMTGTRLTFAVVSCAYLVLAVPFEERTLVAASGGTYLAYSKAVRWRLIPGVY